MKANLTSHARRGMVILEVLIAVLFFGMAAVGLMQAITASAQTAVTSQQELRMLLRLQSRLTEVSKDQDSAQLYKDKPETTSNPDELGVWTRAVITKYEDIQTQIDKQPVNDMYHIEVTAFYDNFGQTGQISAETVRYARLYAKAGAAGAAAPPTPAPAPKP